MVWAVQLCLPHYLTALIVVSGFCRHLSTKYLFFPVERLQNYPI